MLEYLQGVSAWVPVVLKNSAGSPTVTVPYNTVNFSVIKANGQQSDVTLLLANWVEVTATAYNNQGYYNYFLTGSAMDVTGVFQYAALVSGSVPYFGFFKVVSGDTEAIYNRLGAPVSGTISNDIQNVPAAASSGGFTAQDRAYLSATYVTASALPTNIATVTTVDSAISSSFWTGDRQNLQAIKTKTDNLPLSPASTGDVTSSRDNVNTNTNSRITEIKGTGWAGSYDTLHSIGGYASSTYLSGALQVSISSTINDARNYLAGASFIVGTDDLHGLSVQIQGITPSSGGGGFSTTDRTMLVSAYSQTLALPADPASQGYLSGVITASAHKVMGSGSYGAASGSTIYQVWNNVNTYGPAINAKTTNLPSSPASSQEVWAVTATIGGVGYASATHSLVQIYSQFTTGSYGAQDREWLSATYVSSSIIYSAELGNNSLIGQVKAKTDNLPSDPVSTAWILVPLNQIASASAVSGGFSQGDRDNITAIKTKTDNLPAQPADATVTFGTSDRNVLNQVYSKANALPVDPCSQTYVTLVSQSLDARLSVLSSSIRGSEVVSTDISASVQVVSASVVTINNKLGTPAASTVSQDIANVANSLGAIGTNASNAANYSQAAASSAASAAAYSSNASINTNTIITNQGSMDTKIGTPKSGSIAADIHDTRDNVSGGGGGGSTDISSITRTLGTPNKTISDDLRQIGKIVQDVQKKVT